jgi:hypothetical protein
MKKILFLIITFVSLIFLVSCDYDSAIFYSSYPGGTINYYYNDKNNKAFVGRIEISNINNEIIILDECNDCTVNRLGGFHGTGVKAPFAFDLLYLQNNDLIFSDIYKTKDKNIDYEKKKINDYFAWNEHEIINININLTLPKSLNEILLCDADYVLIDKYANDNNEIVVKIYRPVVYLNISEDNKTFYTQDGKLYKKKTDELVDCFIYE